MDRTPSQPNLATAQQMDRDDALADFRQEFVQGGPEFIYLDGNSLGRLPRRTIGRVRSAVEAEWGQDLIRSWNGGWFEAPSRIGDRVGEVLGADRGQTLVTDSTSVNLFKLAMAALQSRPERHRIVTDALNFPSDLYILQGCCRLLGGRHQLVPIGSADGISVEEDDLFASIDEHTVLVALSHVAFRSGFLYDVEAVTRRAHEAGALILWDMSHSAGVVPIELDRWGVDFAVGCTYKYLNGGPGAPAFLYVRRELQEATTTPIWGWFGQGSPFAFDLQYKPSQDVRRFLVGTPPVLSLLALEPALDVILEAGVDRIRLKSVGLTSYLVYLADALLAPLGFSLGSPRDESRRGSHVSLRHPEGYRISRALIEEMDLLPDFREPDNIRLGLAPLYTTYTDVWKAVERIRRTVTEKRYLRYSSKRQTVT